MVSTHASAADVCAAFRHHNVITAAIADLFSELELHLLTLFLQVSTKSITVYGCYVKLASFTTPGYAPFAVGHWLALYQYASG